MFFYKKIEVNGVFRKFLPERHFEKKILTIIIILCYMYYQNCRIHVKIYFYIIDKSKIRITQDAEPVMTMSKLKLSTPLIDELTVNVKVTPIISPGSIVLPS